MLKITPCPDEIPMVKSQIPKPNTFLYFTYGANSLKFRVRMCTPSAEFVDKGRLDNYRLDFLKHNKVWGGPVATIVPTANAHVWGVIWRLDNDDMQSLDNILEYNIMKYFIKNMKVQTCHMGAILCRVYIQVDTPLPRGDNDPVPAERWASWALKQILLMAAKEHYFPEYYIQQLKRMKHNGDEGCIRVWCLLKRYENNEPCDCYVPGRIPRKPLKLQLR